MYIVHVILVLTRICWTKSSSLVAPSRLLVTRIGPCFGTNLPLAISEMSLTRKEFDYATSGKLNISVDVADGWSVKATMQKCHDIRNLDTCDHYKSLTVVKSGCDGEYADDTLMQDKFFQYVTPRLECPIKAGVYQISNFTFLTEDIDLTTAESKISTSVFGFTYRLDGFDEEYRKIICVDAYLQLIYVRNHDWISNEKSKPAILNKNSTAKDIIHNKPDDNDDDDAAVTNDDSKRNNNENTENIKENKEKDSEEHTVEDDQQDGDVDEVENEDSKDKKLNDENKDVKHDDDDTDNDKVVEQNEGTEHDKNDDEGSINKDDNVSVDDTRNNEQVKDDENAEVTDRPTDDNDQNDE